MTKEIPLTRGMVAVVDDADYEMLAQHKWHVMSIGYPARTVKGPKGWRVVPMHQFIVGELPKGQCADHIDRNRLNNTRANLRVVTAHWNSCNKPKYTGKSKYRGVSPTKRNNLNPWVASIGMHGVGKKKCRVHLGYFRTEEDAARAWDAAALEWFGPLVELNFTAEEARAMGPV